MSRFANTIAAVTGAYVAASFAVQLLNWRSRKAYPLPPLPDAIAQKSTRIPLKRRPNISLRVVYIAHRLGPNVPLVVFLHGMGAGVHSWIEQIETANILAVDLLGHGESDGSWCTSDYDLRTMAKDIAELLSDYALDSNIIVAHSMGTGLTAHLLPLLSDKGITVSAAVLLGARVQVRRQLYWFSFLPSLAIELMRLRDRAGGLYSHSVNRFLHHAASDTLRRQQLAFNMRSRTSTLVGILRNVHSFPGTQDWYRIACPLLLLVGDDEKVNPPADSYTIQQLAPDAREVVVVPQAGHNLMTEQPGLVGAIIARFLVEDVGLRVMDPAYQMTVMSEPGNKWSLKNYDKWKRTPAVTEETVRGTLFRGMKVMREGDDEHSPMLLRQRHPEIGLVIDISHDEPPYTTNDPSHIRYVKVATTSKIPPTPAEVARFIAVVNDFWKAHPRSHIGVHCHYGFNRTGFMICAYMVEERGMSVADALQEWAKARPPGIRHAHFHDELFLRYAPAAIRESPKKKLH